jgi:hypothetical protein
MNDDTREALIKSVSWCLAWSDANGQELPLEVEIQAAELIKTIPFFRRALSRLVQTLYDGIIGGEFVTVAKNLISGQIRKAYQEAWKENGKDSAMPDYMTQAAGVKVAEQQAFVDGYFHDIVEARVNGTSVEPLKARVDMWTNRYNEALDEGKHLIALNEGQREKWVLGATEKHCPFCRRYAGIVALASEWEAAGVHPQNAKNPALTGTIDGEKGCEGWLCDCRREPTDQRRSPKALETLINIVMSGQLDLIKYDPDQPRDENGMWTDTGVGGMVGGEMIGSVGHAMEIVQMRDDRYPISFVREYIKEKKIDAILGYHVSSVENGRKMKTEGINTSYQPDRPDATYFFLDKQDAYRNANLLGHHGEYAILTVKIPADEAAEIEYDGLYNGSFNSSYSAARIRRRIPAEWIFRAEKIKP